MMQGLEGYRMVDDGAYYVHSRLYPWGEERRRCYLHLFHNGLSGFGLHSRGPSAPLSAHPCASPSIRAQMIARIDVWGSVQIHWSPFKEQGASWRLVQRSG
jgi:hypothetical protein